MRNCIPKTISTHQVCSGAGVSTMLIVQSICTKKDCFHGQICTAWEFRQSLQFVEISLHNARCRVSNGYYMVGYYTQEGILFCVYTTAHQKNTTPKIEGDVWLNQIRMGFYVAMARLTRDGIVYQYRFDKRNLIRHFTIKIARANTGNATGEFNFRFNGLMDSPI